MCASKPPPIEKPPPPPSQRDEDIIARENRVTRARAALKGGSVQSTLGQAGTSGSAAPATVQKPTLGV